MKQRCRSCWQNCVQYADQEILAIDEMEDAIAPVNANAAKVRGLISTLEICHHKAERWVENIIEAIGTGETTKGLGSRVPGTWHPVETVWQNACAALAEWCSGCPAGRIDLKVGDYPASELLDGLGQRTPLKEWQVQRVIEKIRGSIHFPFSLEDPSVRYRWILLGDEDCEAIYRQECPSCYAEHEEFWRTTAKTIIHDTVNGDPSGLSLGIAIDMLMPCHWGFVDNLRIVLDAVGGNLDPGQPFMACGRNIGLTPLRARMEVVCQSLDAFCGNQEGQHVETALLAVLGEPSREKQWLAASLSKTIRLQLDPPSDLQEVCALAGPEWINA